MIAINFVKAESHFAKVVDDLSKADKIAVDIESNGFFRYHERICLIQITAGGTVFIIDPLTLHNVGPLGDLLADGSIEKIFHASLYDLRSFDRDWGFRVNNVFDTQIAASFAGSVRLGLQPVLKEFTDFHLLKDRKLQRSDWTLRPLSSKALTYAANDVIHLIQLRDTIAERLKKLSRLSWAQEEFKLLEKERYVQPELRLAFLSVKGSGELDGKGLAILRSLFEFREREAIRLDRPVFKVIPDFALLKLSAEPGSNLSTTKGLGRYGRPPACRYLRSAINRGKRASPVIRQKQKPSRRRWTPDERLLARSRLKNLKNWRRKIGLELDLEPGILWPAASLECLARYPCSVDAELSSPEIRNWQKHEFGEKLRTMLESLGT